MQIDVTYKYTESCIASSCVHSSMDCCYGRA